MRLFQLALCIALSTTAVVPAMAQENAPSSADIKKAASSYDIGRERFREGKFTEAAEKFEAADDFAPSAPALRLAIAARKEAGQLPRAATHAALALERYAGQDPIASEAQALLDEVSSDLAKVSVVCDSPCELLLNNRIVHGAAAETRVLYVSPGSVTVRAGWSQERTQSETIDVGAGEEREVSFYAPEIPAEPEPVVAAPIEETNESGVADQVAADEGGWSPAVFWVGAGVTAAAGAATIGLGINAINNPGRQAVIDECGDERENCDLYKQGVRNQTYATVAACTTAAAGVFTIITGVWLTNWSGGEQESLAYRSGDLSIQPTFAVGDGALLGASGTF